jgi:hypothetical protein
VFTAAKLGIFRVMAMGFRHFLSHHHVKYHHQHETNGKANKVYFSCYTFPLKV